MSIITKNKNGNNVLLLFEDGITIDQKLPKWVNAAKELSERKAKKTSEGSVRIVSRETRAWQNESGEYNSYSNMDTPFTIYTTPEHYEIQENVNFDDIAAANLKELTVLIKAGEINNILAGYTGMNANGRSVISNEWTVQQMPINANDGVFTKMRKKANNWLAKKLEKKPEFDAIQFFTNVKLTSKEGAITYRDRVSKYLQAIHNASAVGQTALLEQLLSEMIANKYEALLNSKGCYYAIGEADVVKFAEKTERGVNLCYLKNFIRPLPQEVVDKLNEVNSYEVFDNYVVMHYDPANKAHKETRKEEAKRKDPILFGVISGSRKLYYITDWVDEVCDLTLEKFVDTLGAKKSDFLEGEEPKKEKKKEEKPAEDAPAKKTPKKTTKKSKKE